MTRLQLLTCVVAVCTLPTVAMQARLPIPDPAFDRMLNEVAARTPSTAAIRLVGTPRI